MSTKIFILAIFLPLASLTPIIMDHDPDDDTGIEQPDPNFNQSLTTIVMKGLPVNQLISEFKFNNIESEIADVAHARRSCGTTSGPTPKNGIRDSRKRWYAMGDGKYFVPLVIDSRYTQRERDILYAAMIEIQDTTCIRFYVYRQESDLRGYDYVGVTKENSGCFSEGLGKLGKGRQQMNLQPTDANGATCMIKGIAVHELLHVIGFHHQQVAPERDDYVTILWENIQDSPGARYQFQKLSYNEADSFGAPYDYGSIMHYARRDFSKNGRDTIVPRQSGVTIGQIQRISNWDAYKVNKMYNCPT